MDCQYFKTAHNYVVHNPKNHAHLSQFTNYIAHAQLPSTIVITSGVFLILCGILTQTVSLLILFYLSLQKLARLILVTSLVVVTTLFYLRTTHFQQYIRLPLSVGKAALNIIENVNGKMMRRIVIGIVFVPVLMESVALCFLSRIVGENCGWGYWFNICFCIFVISLEGALLLSSYFHIAVCTRAAIKSNDEPIDTQYVICGSNIMFQTNSGQGGYQIQIGRVTIVRKEGAKLIDCKVHMWIFLSVLAVLKTVIGAQANPIHLAGPFLLASGAFLVLSRVEESDDLAMDLLRRIIRVTLRDLLKELGENVAEDEMLRLVMLRWIVDFWSSKVSKVSKDDIGNSQHASNDEVSFDSSPTSDTKNDGIANQEQMQSSDQSQFRWEELSTMLSLTTDQMHDEVNVHPRRTSNSSSENCHNQCNNESLKSLQTMLKSLNADERAREAVNSYKLAIEEIPPSRNVAVFIAIAKRSPSVLSSILLSLVGPLHAIPCVIILSPLVVLEIYDILEWIHTSHHSDNCQRNEDTISATRRSETASKDKAITFHLPESFSPMEIILNATALRVWANVQTSSDALELGLTALKCAHTAEVATDLTFNVISLAQFAAEVKNGGLGVGLRLIILDLFYFHRAKSGNSERNGKYTSTAINLMDNSKVLRNNIDELIHEGTDETSPLNSILRGIFRNKEDPKLSKDRVGSCTESNAIIQNQGTHTNNIQVFEGADNDLISDDAKHDNSQLSTETSHSQLATETSPILSNETNLQLATVPDDLEIVDDDSDGESWTTINAQPSQAASAEFKECIRPNANANTNDVNDATDPSVETEPAHQDLGGLQRSHVQWVGASIAVLGTIIGGIALTNNTNNQVETSNKKKNETSE